MTTIHSTLLLLLLSIAGCEQIDPYTRAGAWRPNGANDTNSRAMVAVPSDLVQATPAVPADGTLATAALVRLRHDRVRPLLDSGLAQLVPVNAGSTVPPAATPAPGNGE